MPTSDLDLPLLPSADQIRRREFATIRRGYDPEQVRDYLGSVAAQVEALEKGLKDARLAMDSSEAAAPSMPMPAAPELDPYDRISKRFAGLLATADREASRIVDEAKTEADRIKVDAQATAETARQEGTEALGSARREADRVLEGLSTRREAVVEQLGEMRARLLGVADELGSTIETSAQERSASVEADADPSPEAAGDADAGAATDVGEPDAGDPLLDPRYEDLWVSADGGTESVEAGSAETEVELDALLGDEASDDVTMDIPDLASIELDFDEGTDSDD